MAQPVAPSQRLPAITGPLGGAPQRPPAQPAATASRPGAFPDLLAGQIGTQGQMGLPGVPGLPGGAAASMPFLDPMAAVLGGQTGAAGALSSLASPQLARAAATMPVLTPPSAAPATPAAQRAIQWALSRVGRQDWNNLCERFVEEAFGSGGVYASAKDAARDLVAHRGRSSLTTAPPGALLYFAPDETNQFYGHAAIYLGDGKMVSARPNGVQVESVYTPYNLDRYVGWGDGTRLPPRGRTAPAPPAPAGAMTVATKAPAKGAIPGAGAPLIPAGTGLASSGANSMAVAAPAAASSAAAGAASQRVAQRMPAPPPAPVAQAAARTRLSTPALTAAIDRVRT